MPWNPGVTDISGQLRAQGMVNQAQGIGQGVANFAEQFAKSSEENAKFNAKNKAMENLVKTHAELFGLTDPEQLKGFLDTNPRESPLARYERLSTLVEGTVTAKKLQQMEEAKKNEAMQRTLQQMQIDMAKQKMAQEGKSAAALSEAIKAARAASQPQVGPSPAGEAVLKGGFGADIRNMSTAPKVTPPSSAGPDVLALAQQMMEKGGTVQDLDKLDQFLKLAMPPKQGRMIGPVVVRPAGTDKDGNPLQESIDSNTGQSLGIGPAPRTYRSAKEEAEAARMIEENKLDATESSKFLTNIADSAERARYEKAAFGRINDLYSKGATSGALTPFGNEMRSLLVAAGRPDPGLVNNQALEAAFNELAFTKGREYVKGTGAVSNYERQSIEAALPSIKKTPESNRLILDLSMEIADRSEKLDEERRRLKKEGKSPKEIRDALEEKMATMPLKSLGRITGIPDDANKELDAIAASVLKKK